METISRLLSDFIGITKRPWIMKDLVEESDL